MELIWLQETREKRRFPSLTTTMRSVFISTRQYHGSKLKFSRARSCTPGASMHAYDSRHEREGGGNLGTRRGTAS